MERVTYVVGGVVILLLGAGGLVWAGIVRDAGRPVEVVEFVTPPSPVPRAERGGSTMAMPAIGPVVAVPAIGEPTAPSFDVVRVGPGGTAVIAGRAAPGAEVVVRDGTVDVATTRAGRDGTFVALPPAPLAAGGRELTLASRDPAGGAETKGDGSVLLVVPGEAGETKGVAGPVPDQVPAKAPVQKPAAAPPKAMAAPGPAMALLVPEGGRPRVLGARREAVAGPTVDTVDYDEGGMIRFNGGGTVGQAVRVYLDNLPRGEAQPDGTGRWTLTPSGAVSPGVHSVRVDQVDGAGRVVARVEVPFERAPVAAAALAAAGGRVVVQPGQNLWRMARVAYGRGIRYRVIYLANREQIRNPQRIYPGQVFAVPAAARADGGG